ncbi:V-set and immunoglobulin domain-containing protein 8-like isoform X2 [Sceloporus undulatus]|nr:V-set and immunoglobulin domain-containing protein 8-like isoform X2 [Sceloporus undulatus]
MYLAKGQSVKLVCPYELEPQDHGPNSLDIEWTQMNSDPTSLDNVILSYHDQKVIHPGYNYVQRFGNQEGAQYLSNYQNMVKDNAVGHHFAPCCSGLQQRVNFAMPDPSQYDASINLENVQISDSATYECKVKKTTLASRKVTIMVLEKPSVPKCSITGKVAVGHEVTLCCASEAGNSPLTYQWTKLADHLHGNLNPALTTQGLNPGDIVIKNLSYEHVGMYQCSVANKVGYAQCVLEITFENDSSYTVIAVGVSLGCLLILVLVLCLAVGLIYYFRRSRCKEEANQIRVDAAPPRDRSKSPQSVFGYLSNRLSFQRGKYESPKEQEGIEILCPAQDQDQDQSSSVNSCNKESEIQNNSSVFVTTKARVHHAPVIPSYLQSKSRAQTSFQPPTISSLGEINSSTFERNRTQAKRHHPGQYGDVSVIVSANSREDLVV